MTQETCPVCKGSGVAVAKPYYNDVWYDKPSAEICWLCKGAKVILVEPSPTRMHIHKYWLVKDEVTNE